MRLEPRVILALRIQAIGFTGMSCGMHVACGTAFLQRDLDERTAKQHRGQWMLAFEGRTCDGGARRYTLGRGAIPDIPRRKNIIISIS